MNLAGSLVTDFVERSGGIEKVRAVLDAMRTMPDEKRADFIRASAQTDPGARQLYAAALLGFAISVAIHDMAESK